MTPVPKKRYKGACVMDNFRGISLLSTVYKAMCMIVQDRLTQVVEERQLLVEEQGGFRKGRGCRDQMLTLTLLGQYSMRTKRGMFAGFIDFKKAYESVDRGKLWACLERLGLGGRLTSFLKAAYSNLRCEVKVGEQCSDAFSVTNGLRQGCTLSLLLFSIYVNSLVGELKKRGLGVMCGKQRIPALLYADDTVILAEMLRTGLRILKEWCVTSGQ